MNKTALNLTELNLIELSLSEMTETEGGSLDFLRRLSYLDFLISRKATGNVNELAERMQISRSNLHLYLRVLREDLQAPVKYCRKSQSYSYSEEWSLEKGLKNQKII
ncbi:MAG: hypothetical protein MUE85_11655 [Microscillaceae bacterium]|jgi:hypothetical protein|nr:hypothetical protein [Microscillaceae bacterium]